jgi:hypothetical protein
VSGGAGAGFAEALPFMSADSAGSPGFAVVEGDRALEVSREIRPSTAGIGGASARHLRNEPYTGGAGRRIWQTVERFSPGLECTASQATNRGR